MLWRPSYTTWHAGPRAPASRRLEGEGAGAGGVADLVVLTEEAMAMTGQARWLITLGRWVVVLTHVLECAILALSVVGAAYFVITGEGRLKPTEPWESILTCVFFVFCPAVILCWGVFCLAFVVLLRRRGRAGSLKQIATILRVAVPFLGLGHYESIVRGLADPRDSTVNP